MDFKIRTIGKNRLDEIEPLWDKLKEMHIEKAQNFSDHFKNLTFKERCKKFKAIKEQQLRIVLLESCHSAAGYCIATINRGVGEIDSLYVDDSCRQNGYGAILLDDCIQWLKENQCEKIEVSIAEGNESVMEFYKKMGFSTRSVKMELK